MERVCPSIVGASVGTGVESPRGNDETEIGLIGAISVRRAGAAVPLPQSRKCRALIAYLAATSRPHRRERLCEMLWEVPDDPKGALRWSLSKVRRVIGDALVADRETVRIEPDLVRMDLNALFAGTAEEASRLDRDFAEGLDLPRCPEFQAWLAGIREDVRQAQVRTLAELVRRLRSEPERALVFARIRVERDPLDGDARRDLVELLDAAGRGEEAKRQRALAVEALREAAVPVPAALSHPRPGEGAAPPPIRRVQFCRTEDGVRIAYCVSGRGPPLIKTANWLSHLEYEWESPLHRHWIEEIGRMRTLVRYDARGGGLSDRTPENLTLAGLLQDLETVTQALPDQRFDLLGVSQGCASAVAYAVKHPEKVRSLILFGGFASGWRFAAPEVRARWEAMITLTGSGWGQDNPAFRQMFTSLFLPRATADQAASFNELQRVSASPEQAERMQRALGELDVREMLPKVRTRTIVFHCRGDAMVPFSAGLQLASKIPGAEFVGLDSDNHLPLADEPAWAVFVDHLREFLARPG